MVVVVLVVVPPRPPFFCFEPFLYMKPFAELERTACFAITAFLLLCMLFLNGCGLDSLPLWLVMSDCLVRFSMNEDEEKRAGCFTSIVSCLS